MKMSQGFLHDVLVTILTDDRERIIVEREMPLRVLSFDRRVRQNEII
jgi:hypothetical protein